MKALYGNVMLICPFIVFIYGLNLSDVSVDPTMSWFQFIIGCIITLIGFFGSVMNIKVVVKIILKERHNKLNKRG